MNLILVEDDTILTQSVAEHFGNRGIQVACVGSAERAIEAIERHRFDAAIIDIVLPGMDGLALVELLRSRHNTLPVLIMSGKSSVDDRVRGLRRGGDDYLCKPFDRAELEARVRALVRRTALAAINSRFLRTGHVEVDRLHRLVRCGGTEIQLRPKEYAVLECLCENAGSVVSKAMLLERIWGYNFDTKTNIVDVVVSRMRAKLEHGRPERVIRTVYGVGYSLEIVEK